MTRLTQIRRIELALMDDGKVSRNRYLDIPYDKITRMGDVIHKLRLKGWDIVTEETDRDTIYHAKPKSEEWFVVPITGERFSKKVWH